MIKNTDTPAWDTTQKSEPPYYLMVYPNGELFVVCLSFADGQTIHQSVTKATLDAAPVGFWLDTLLSRINKKTPA
jgi:hypothetical protein